MTFSNPQLVREILSAAETGRPIVLSKGISDTWMLQCNGVHFIRDPANEDEVAVVKQAVNELADAGYLRDDGWVGANKHLHVTDAGQSFLNQVRAEQQEP